MTTQSVGVVPTVPGAISVLGAVRVARGPAAPTRTKERGRIPLLALAALLIPLITACPPRRAWAGTTIAEAGSGFWAAGNKNQDGSTTWRFSTPTKLDTIRWISGSNNTDGKLNGPYNFGPETKFGFNGNNPTPLAKTFLGFTQNDGPGLKGSTTSTTGGGSSGTVPGTLWGTNYEANWTINATGVLGGVAGASWTSRAQAIDPYAITSTQLQESGVSGSSYNLFFAASLGSGSFTPGGSIGLDASYLTASGSTDLLNISIDGNGAVVTNSNPSNLSFYLLSSLTEGPTENPAEATTLSGIQSLLNKNLSNNSLTSPLYVGIVWDNVPVPTSTLSDGALAEIQIGSTAVASAVPEPSTWLLLGTGVLGAICWKRRARGGR